MLADDDDDDDETTETDYECWSKCSQEARLHQTPRSGHTHTHSVNTYKVHKHFASKDVVPFLWGKAVFLDCESALT